MPLSYPPKEKFMNPNMSLRSLWATLLAFIMAALVPGAWAASKYKVLYSFKGGSDGIGPTGLIFDPAGNLYGTTDVGGGGGCTNEGCGIVFQLTTSDGKWSEKVLLRLKGMKGPFPDAGVIIDAEGNLYGTASGHFGGYGIVFKLTPGANGNWSVSVLHAFAGGNDGQEPYSGLVRDAAGKLYGTTVLGGGYGSCYNNLYCGTVYELSPPRLKGGKWKEKILYRFRGKSDGGFPSASLILDAKGNLYGTTEIGGAYGWGTVFEMTHGSNGKWAESVLHSFGESTDGADPTSAVIFDKVGNLYGTTYGGPGANYGTVFKLTPSSEGWKESLIHVFQGGSDGGNPLSGVIVDASGSLYGTTSGELTGGNGTIFELTPRAGGVWTETVLHSFTGGKDGGFPAAPLIMDSVGNLYGTAAGGGNLGWGLVFEITP
jgi:uncharacterized repeat protein (TIGR03803 family)